MASESLNGGRPRIRIVDHHGHSIMVQRSLLRPDHLALINRPNQKVIFLTREDAVALVQYLIDYLTDTQETPQP